MRMREAAHGALVALVAGGCARPPAPAAPCPAVAKASPARPSPAPPAPEAPDELTSLRCLELDAPDSAPPVVSCGADGCELTYTATRMTTSPAGYQVGAKVPVTATAPRWRLLEDGERLHVDILDGGHPRLLVDGLLAGAWGSEATIGHLYVGVVTTPGASAPPVAAVSIAGAPRSPAATRDEVRVAVRCGVSVDLQE